MATQGSSLRFSMRCLVVTLLAAVMVTLALPAVAIAREYSISRVDIDATVASDGSLTVKEAREFDFDGSFNGVYWKIPTGSYEGRQVETSILSVGEIVDGEFVEFAQDDSGSNHSYQLSGTSSYVQVKLFSAHEDEKVQFAIVYKDTNVALRYDDVSSLYWKFVSDGWDEPSNDVTCTVHLPAPEGSTVTPMENVRAWGHGPLDADISFSGNDVVYRVPGVGTSEYAEARITFPSTWLADAESLGGEKLSSILEEEKGWADEANARRQQARVAVGATVGFGFGIPVLSIVGGVLLMLRYRKSHRAQFDDKYFRDVPSNDHPAVLGALLNEGNATDECLTASLMWLTDQGAMKLELVKLKKKGFLGSEKLREDYCVTQLKYYDKLSREDNDYTVDRETLRLLFQRLAPKSKTSMDEGMLYFSDLEDIARRYPESFDNAYKDWKAAVERACQRRGFFTDERKTGKGLAIALTAIDIVVGMAAFILAIVFDLPLWAMLAIPAACVAGAVVVSLLAAKMDSMSEEAMELTAKLKALRNWLKDFTRLEEAVPQDVVLWNRLLVMAVVLGVADEVIKQLKVAAPFVLDDPYLSPVYGWYYHGGPTIPSHAFTSAANSAHSVSASKLASSSSSSGGGGGGGFSGGGGGGFGGGGGGGAF